MKLFRRRKNIVKYFAHNLSIVLAVVLIWRGIWYVIDGIDMLFFGGDHVITSIGGIILGVIILYWPDKDLKELGKL